MCVLFVSTERVSIVINSTRCSVNLTCFIFLFGFTRVGIVLSGGKAADLPAMAGKFP